LLKIRDSILFGSVKTGLIEYSDTQSSKTLGIGFDQDLKTTGVTYAVGLGPNDESTCTPVSP